MSTTMPLGRKKRILELDESGDADKSTNSNGRSQADDLGMEKPIQEKLKRRRYISSDEEESEDRMYDFKKIAASTSKKIESVKRKLSVPPTNTNKKMDGQVLELNALGLDYSHLADDQVFMDWDPKRSNVSKKAKLPPQHQSTLSSTKPKHLPRQERKKKEATTKAIGETSSTSGGGGGSGRPAQRAGPPVMPMPSEAIDLDEDAEPPIDFFPISNDVLQEAEQEATADDPLAARLQKLKLQIMVKNSVVADAVAASVMSLSEEQIGVFAREGNVDLHRDPNAIQPSSDDMMNKLDEIVSKVRIDCGFDEEDESDDDGEENIDAQPKKRRSINKTEQQSINAFGDYVGQSKITFKNATFTLARSSDELGSFVALMKEKINELASENHRQKYGESLSERTRYRSITSMHLWLVFCCTRKRNPEEFSPAMLRDFRDWMLKLESNSNRMYADPSRFNKSLSKETVATNVTRVYTMYKLMGFVDLEMTLAKFMGGKEEFAIWRRWMMRQAGDRAPLSRFVIGPEEIDYFGEQLKYEKDVDFQSLLYLLTMVQTGARSASLLRKVGSTNVGLLIEDVRFKLLPDRRLSAEISITSEKQTRDILRVRVVPIEDRISGFSLPSMLFAHFIRLGVFSNSVDDMLNVEKNVDNYLFIYKDEFKKTNVFRRTDEKNGQLTPHGLTIDERIFELFSRVLRLPRRGFSARSIRQGTALSIIQPMVEGTGFFHRTDVVEKLVSTNIWEGKTALRYVDEYQKKSFNSTVSLYGSDAVNPHGDTAAVRKYIPPACFRLPENEYISDDNAQVTAMVKSLPEMTSLYAKIQTLESRLDEMFKKAKIRVNIFGPVRMNEPRAKKLNAAGVDANLAIKLKDDINSLRFLAATKLRRRVRQYADHLNYERFLERKNNPQCSRSLQLTGLAFDWRLLAQNLESYNNKAAIWLFSPFRTPDVISLTGVECAYKNCDKKFVNDSDLRSHMTTCHGTHFVHAARQAGQVLPAQQSGSSAAANKRTTKKRVEAVGKNSKKSQGTSTGGEGGSGRPAQRAGPLVMPMPTEADGDDDEAETVNTNAEMVGERLVCKSDGCIKKKGYKSLYHLKKHFSERHWAAYFCESCGHDYTEKEYDETEHVDHQISAINPNFPYQLYRLLESCGKCERYVISNSLPSVSCVLTLEKIKRLFEPIVIDEYYSIYEMDRDNPNSSTDILKAKRMILYKLLRYRLYGVGETTMPLPSCLLKEVQRRFSHNTNDPEFQLFSQEK